MSRKEKKKVGGEKERSRRMRGKKEDSVRRTEKGNH